MRGLLIAAALAPIGLLLALSGTAMGLWLGIILICLSTILCWVLVVGRREAREIRNGTFAQRFVVVEDDGSARELTADEIEYLNTEFQGADGARPYIKSSYRQLTPDGKIGGFLAREKLPRNVKVKSSL